MSLVFMACAVALALSDPRMALADDEKPKGEDLTECLLLPPVGRFGRLAVHQDAVEASIAAGKWTPPKAGDAVALPDGPPRNWEPAKAGEDRWFNHPALFGGYAYFPVQAEEQRVAILEAAGHNMVYVNGEPRAGDPYAHGYVHLPILLNKGTNHLLFQGGRGRLKARLVSPKAAAQFDVSDTMLADAIVGEKVQMWAAIVVINATTETLDQATIQTTSADSLHTVTPVPSIPPLSTRKVAFQLTGPAMASEGTHTFGLELVRKKAGDSQTLDTAKITVRAVRPEQLHKRTFKSDIDGSVQYYAVLPASGGRQPPGGDKLPGGDKPALVLTLHGAGVDATGQAAAYHAKSWAHIVAATNRRPFGFDWEDWGRLDALEVLDLAQKQLDTNPLKTYVTGHSMGGHGVWHLGVTFPDRFAAIGPSAGWVSMWTYAGGRKPDPNNGLTPAQRLGDIVGRAATPSDTLALARNCNQHGVYVLHGEKDDNVPVEQARIMKKHLSGFHRDFEYHEEPGMGHWWHKDNPGGGTACVDWPAMFDFFAKHERPLRENVRHVEFITASPGVSAWCHWAGIEGQIQQLKPSSVNLRYDPSARRFSGTTDNVLRLALDVKHLKPGETIHVELDDQRIQDIPWPEKTGRVWLQRSRGRWLAVPEPSPSLKGPHRYGPFKEAFRNRVLFVHGTKGTPEENAWALAKARFDAETFWYRGNGSIDVVADTAFDPSAERDRNVILYGNADTNAAWKPLLAGSPIQVRRGRISVGDHEEVRDDLGCLFIRPRPGSDRASVGVVAGTGVPGMRLTDRLAYFISGVGYPDWLVLGPDVLSQGVDGVRGAGFFGLDWSLTAGESVWRE